MRIVVAAALLSTAAQAAEPPALTQLAVTTGRYIANAKACGGLEAEWQNRFKSVFLMVNMKYSAAIADEWSAAVIREANIVPPCDRDSLYTWRSMADKEAMFIRTGVPQ
jgi:hypothetical protein